MSDPINLTQLRDTVIAFSADPPAGWDTGHPMSEYADVLLALIDTAEAAIDTASSYLTHDGHVLYPDAHTDEFLRLRETLARFGPSVYAGRM